MGEIIVTFVTFLITFCVFMAGHAIGKGSVIIDNNMLSVAQEKCKNNGGVDKINAVGYSCTNGAEFQFKNG